MSINVDGLVVSSRMQAHELMEQGRITKRAYKKIRNYFEATEKKNGRLAKFGVFTPAPAEPENLEDAWDDPGAAPGSISAVQDGESFVDFFRRRMQQAARQREHETYLATNEG